MKGIRTLVFLLLSLFMAFVLSCEDPISSNGGSNDSLGGDPPVEICPTDNIKNPVDKAELVDLIDKYIADTDSVDLTRIDISLIKDMSKLFKDKTTFNGDIHCWDMSEVTNVDSMFEGARAFNQDLSGWKLKAGVVSSKDSADAAGETYTPTKMFYKSGIGPKRLPEINFYQYTPADKEALQVIITAEIGKQGAEADLSIIDTSGVIDMSKLFWKDATFNGYIATWDTSNVKNMKQLFDQASAFNQRIGDWDTSSVKTMELLFYDAKVFNQHIGNWNTSSVTNMRAMFYKAAAFNQRIGDWDTGEVTTMQIMFSEANAFTQPIKDWDTSNVKDFSYMFQNNPNFNQDLTRWSNAAAKLISGMFLSAGIDEDKKAIWMKSL